MTDLGQTGAATWRDYKELTKPNVVLLMILTSAIGMFMAVPGMVPLHILVLGNLGIGLCAGSAAAVNHLVDWINPLTAWLTLASWWAMRLSTPCFSSVRRRKIS